MTGPRIGELFAGYGGLGMGVQAVYGGEVAWVSEFDKGANKILAHRFPGVPNHGDITKIDWSQVEPVDILAGGFPCQPVSKAGKRKGTDDNRWLFDEIVRALGELPTRPGLLLLENVPGLLTANSGDAMGRVVLGLAAVGYVGTWWCLRASDVGAPHQRERVFILAYPADAGSQRHGPRQDGRRVGPLGRGAEVEAQERQWAWALAGDRSVPPVAPNPGGQGLQGLPFRAGDTRPSVAGGDSRTVDWRAYTNAIRRWEHILGRAAPAPAIDGRENPAFVEWMMGLPAGWVTDVPALTRNEALKALGNGVVPQQAAEALRVMSAWEMAA